MDTDASQTAPPAATRGLALQTLVPGLCLHLGDYQEGCVPQLFATTAEILCEGRS